MFKTYKLYDDDPYLKEFEANVISLNINSLELDRTAFYPESGGQAGDISIISDVRVVDTQVIEGRIIHVMEVAPGFNIDERVKGRIDWNRRYQIMKLHSAAHIMEHFLYQRLGLIERLGSHVDENKDRADYAYDGRLPADELKLVEAETNEFLSESHKIEILSDAERPGVRIWKCDEIEMPCGGTHVHSTGEIGAVKLKRRNPGKGVERVETSLI